MERNYDEYAEIDLLDILAVLLRYRKMIVFGTIILTFFAGLYIFARPKLKRQENHGDLHVTYTVKTAPLPGAVSQGFSRMGIRFSINDIFLQSFEDYPLVAAEYKRHPFLGDEYPQSEFSYNKMILRAFRQTEKDKNKKWVESEVKKVDVKNQRGSFYIECRVPLKQYQENVVWDFLNEHISALNERTQAEFLEDLQVLEERTADLYNEVKASGLSSQIMAETAYSEQALYDTLENIKNLKNSPFSFYSLEDSHFVIEDEVKRGNAKSLVIAVVFSAFALVCVAFLRYFIGNIRENPESMKLLTAAWNEGK